MMNLPSQQIKKVQSANKKKSLLTRYLSPERLKQISIDQKKLSTLNAPSLSSLGDSQKMGKSTLQAIFMRRSSAQDPGFNTLDIWWELNPEIVKNRSSIESRINDTLKQKPKNTLKYSNLLRQGAESCVEIPSKSGKKKKFLKKTLGGKSIDHTLHNINNYDNKVKKQMIEMIVQAQSAQNIFQNKRKSCEDVPVKKGHQKGAQSDTPFGVLEAQDFMYKKKNP